MKRLILSASLLIALGGAQHTLAQDNIYRILSDDYSRLQVAFTLNNLQTSKVVSDGATFATLTAEGLQPSAEVGAPCLPTFSAIIEVPLCNGFEVTLNDALYDTVAIGNMPLLPVQAPHSKSDTKPRQLSYNTKLYSTDAYYGSIEAHVESIGIARDRRLARLQFSPVSYNPVQGTAIVCRSATVTVRYIESDRSATDELFSRYYSPAFASNASVINSLYPKAVRTTAPVRYLIVANSMFRGHLDSFVEWKRRKGFLTDIVYTDDATVGTTTSSIQAYIQSQYTNATASNPAPTYVLLVGDVDQLPPFSAQVTSPSSDHITDLYYMSWTAGDHLPDCHYGRFSAQSVAQLTPQVQKTLMYEQYTFADPAFLDRAVMVAGVDGGSSGDYGYTHADPAMDYAITNYVNGNHGWSQVMYFKNNTSIIPSDTSNVTIGPSSSGNASTVRTYYNQGAGFINYSAHGGSTGWGTPNFGNSHVEQMTNNQKFGLMIGNCCLTNKFEVSTCFGEALLRKDEYAGAVGYIGGSNSTYWGQDFYWAVGIRSSIGPSMSMAYNASNLGVYDRTFHTHGESYTQWCTTQGSMVMQGNMAVEASTSSSDMKHYYWEIYHLMGDPSVMPYMTQADTMDVAFTNHIVYGTSTLSVTAVPNAYVALTDTATHTLYAAAYADALGQAILTLPPTLPVGIYELTASAQQYRTAFRRLHVIQPNGAFPVVAAISPIGSLDAGTTVPLDVTIHNMGNVTATGITVTLSSSTPLLTLSSTTLTIASLPAGGQIVLDSALYATVNQHAADNMLVSINSTATWSGGTIQSTSAVNLTTKAPVVSLNASSTMLSMLPGATTTLTLTLQNSGHATMPAANLTLSSPSPLFTASTTAPTAVSLAPGATVTRTYTLHADSQLPSGITIPLSVHLAAPTTIDQTLDVFVGQPYIETFEGGNFNLTGWSQGAHQWEIINSSDCQGTYCARSTSNMTHSWTAELSLTRTVAVADSISFLYKVSSESNYDKFHFYIDETDMLTASGEVEWTRAAFPVTPGQHTFKFTYAKDYSVSSGSDCAWIDNVALPHNAHLLMVDNDTLCGGDTAGLPLLTIASDESVILHNYTVLHPSETFDSVSVCDSYTWQGNVYTSSFDTTIVLGLASNCDSTLHLMVNIHHSSVVSDTVNACDSFTWQGTDYTSSTVLGYALTDIYGCDSIYTLHLDVHPSQYDTVTATTQALNYVWNDTMYTESGSYEQHFTTIYGCDSTVTLILTFEHPGNGIGTPTAESLTVYPSPSTGVVHLGATVDEVRVIDLTGHPMALFRHTDTIDLSALPRGVYLLDISHDNTVATCRILLQ